MDFTGLEVVLQMVQETLPNLLLDADQLFERDYCLQLLGLLVGEEVLLLAFYAQELEFVLAILEAETVE